MYNRDITIEGTTMYDTPIAVANKYGMGGGFLTYAYGWMTDTQNAVFIGVIATIVGLVVSAVCQVYKHKREAHAAVLNEELARLNQELARNEEARRKELHEIALQKLKMKIEV